jgi:hypothetical protein
LKKIVALILLFLIGGVVFYFLSLRDKSPIPTSEPPEDLTAFGNTRWGMSSEEAQNAQQATLEPYTSRFQFFTPPKDSQKTFKILEQRTVPFLNRESSVVYVFIEDKLASYHVIMKDNDPDLLYETVRGYLIQKFGNSYSDVNDDGPLKMIWDNPKRFVNLWVYSDELALQKSFHAVFGVVYRPIAEV